MTPASFVFDALEQALRERPLAGRGGLHHLAGSQYVLIGYTGRLVEAGIELSFGSVGAPFDNALAETTNGLHKAEVIRRHGSWRSLDGRALYALRKQTPEPVFGIIKSVMYFR